jgi:hypothetical protein
LKWRTFDIYSNGSIKSIAGIIAVWPFPPHGILSYIIDYLTS